MLITYTLVCTLFVNNLSYKSIIVRLCVAVAVYGLLHKVSIIFDIEVRFVLLYIGSIIKDHKRSLVDANKSK